MATNIIAVIKAGSNTKRVAIADVSMHGCIARLGFAVDQLQAVVLQFFESKGDGKFSGYKPISATVEAVAKRKAKDRYVYDTKIKFNSTINAGHGVVQALNKVKKTPKDAAPVNTKPAPATAAVTIPATTPSIDQEENSLECKNSSLYVIPVRCHMCGHEHIPFRALQSRTMESRTNIFGVPQYAKALPGKEFCDYNLIRVNVCPKCYFASGHATDFIKENRSTKQFEAPFDKAPILEHWNASINQRMALVEANRNGFFGELRNLDQALLSYDLAVMTCDELLKVEMEKKERARNYEIVRKAVFYMMIKAELLMSNRKAAEAEKLLKEALSRLQEIFPFLKRDSSIKAAFLMGMLGIYFEDTKTVSQNVTFLQQYEQNNKIRFGSDEQKALATNKKKLTEAYQSRGDFSRNKLKGFDKPF